MIIGSMSEEPDRHARQHRACCVAGRPAARARRGRPKGGSRKAQRRAADRERDRDHDHEADADTAEILATMAGMPAPPDADAHPEPDADPYPASNGGARAWVPPDAPEVVFWLGLVSAVGTLVHRMMGVIKQPRATSAKAASGARGRARPRAREQNPGARSLAWAW